MNEQKRKKAQRNAGIWFIVILILVCIVYPMVQSHEYKKRLLNPSLQKSHRTLTDKEARMAAYFHKNGSKSPEEMAVAVLNTKSPRLMARIAVVETNANPDLRKYGYRKAHDGAFGVNRYDWGKVSHRAIDQALQAEDALDTFVKDHKGNIIRALNNYGGDKSKKTYANLVLAKLHEVPK